MPVLTVSDIEDAFQRSSPSSIEHTSLCILLQSTIPFDRCLIKQSDTLILGTDVYPVPSELSHLPDGPLFRSLDNTSHFTFCREVNARLKPLFNQEFVTTSLIKYTLYINSNKDNEFGISLDTVTPANLSKYKFDTDILHILTEYDIYTDSNEQYPFLLVHIPLYNKYLKYPVYRYIAQLPFYVRVSHEYRLPTVDHINRDIMNNQRNALRYCDHCQNHMNQCTKTRNTITQYHGVLANGRTSMPKINRDIAYVAKVWSIASFWCRVLAECYTTIKQDATDRHQLQYLTATACKSIEVFGDKATFVDKFVCDVIKLCTTTTFDYNDINSVSQVPCKEYEHYITLSALIKSAHPVSKLRKSFKLHHVAALVNDITRYVVYKDFAHTNFLTVPQPPHTVADAVTIPKRPEEVLNTFEYLNDQDYMDEYYATKTCLPFEEVKGKRRFFWADRNPHTEKLQVHMRFTDDKLATTENVQVIDELQIGEYITSPMTLIRQIMKTR
jgi:hypothetical protein